MSTRLARADVADRFRDDVAGLIGPTGDARFGVAVSGGPDSVALLLLARISFPGRVEAATVDHRLRRASRGEANGVARLCTRLDVPHVVLTLSVLKKGNISATARAARYDALDDWAQARRLDWLMTGHHADDQLETFVMRLNRASGVAGLAGVRRRRGRILRPLLGWRREELAALVSRFRVTAIDDPSNHDDRFDRARLRKMLAGADWIDPVAVARSASALAEADEALDWVIVQQRDQRVDWDEDEDILFYDPSSLPAELRRRALLDALRLRATDYVPRGETVDRALAALNAERKITVGPVACTCADERWAFRLAPPRRTG